MNTLEPHSHASSEITTLWWFMLAAATVVMAGTVVLLVLAWRRRHREGLPYLRGGDSTSTRLVVLFGVLVPVVSVSLLFVFANLEVSKATNAPRPGSTSLTVNVVGRQWFWEFRYPDSGVVTANELHIPTGTRVLAAVTTADVIHSFWVPELNRKVDTIPGRVNRVLLDTSRPGVYRGQCSEFCGLQHAHMAFEVVAQRPADFERWLAAQARPAAQPGGALAQRGERVFMANACASCHTIAGTPARGRLGPDLTHVASRRSLAALTLPNDAARLLAWIRDPQHAKPGAKMPALRLPDADLRAIAAYLMELR